jgi:hypothetical protein
MGTGMPMSQSNSQPTFPLCRELGLRFISVDSFESGRARLCEKQCAAPERGSRLLFGIFDRAGVCAEAFSLDPPTRLST